MQHRLPRWWSIPTIWPACFAIFFGIDVANIDFSRSFDLFSLLESFASGNEFAVMYPAMLPVISAMIGEGLRAVTRDQSDPDSPLVNNAYADNAAFPKGLATSAHTRQRSMTLNTTTSASSMLWPSIHS